MADLDRNSEWVSVQFNLRRGFLSLRVVRGGRARARDVPRSYCPRIAVQTRVRAQVASTAQPPGGRTLMSPIDLRTLLFLPGVVASTSISILMTDVSPGDVAVEPDLVQLVKLVVL